MSMNLFIYILGANNLSEERARPNYSSKRRRRHAMLKGTPNKAQTFERNGMLCPSLGCYDTESMDIESPAKLSP